MKALPLLILLVVSSATDARTVITPNVPGMPGVQDLTANQTVIDDDGEVYESLPGFGGRARILTGPNLYLQGRELIPEAIPGVRTRDYTQPSFTIDDDGE